MLSQHVLGPAQPRGLRPVNTRRHRCVGEVRGIHGAGRARDAVVRRARALDGDGDGGVDLVAHVAVSGEPAAVQRIPPARARAEHLRAVSCNCSKGRFETSQ